MKGLPLFRLVGGRRFIHEQDAVELERDAVAATKTIVLGHIPDIPDRSLEVDPRALGGIVLERLQVKRQEMLSPFLCDLV